MRLDRQVDHGLWRLDDRRPPSIDALRDSTASASRRE
jgi:hypothetical protein